MKTSTFSEIVERLQGFDAWLKGLGIKPKNDRIHNAIAVTQNAAKGWEKFRNTGELTKIGNSGDYYFSIVEALEFADIFDAFKDAPHAEIAPVLSRALDGPARPADENQNNASGRNTMFELALGAEMKLRGAAVKLGDPDLTLEGEQRFVIECKRPARESSIRANIRGAADQLALKLDRAENRGALGMIAVSLARIHNPGTKIFVTKTQEGKEILGDKLALSMRQHESDWRKKHDFSSRICAVLFNVVTPAAIGDQQEQRDSLVKLAYSTVMDTGNGTEAFRALAERLKGLLPTD
jgi:hypothetical protein